MYKTGLSKWVGDGIIAMMGGEPSAIAMVAVFSVMALLLSELTSHTAATNMIGPLAITAAISAGMNPVPVSVAIALSASLGFMLPVIWIPPQHEEWMQLLRHVQTASFNWGLFLMCAGLLILLEDLIQQSAADD